MDVSLWLDQLANLSFTIKYCARTLNRVTDTLSHTNWPEITGTAVNQVLNVHLEKGHPVTSFCHGQQVIPVEFDQLKSNSLDQDIDHL